MTDFTQPDTVKSTHHDIKEGILKMLLSKIGVSKTSLVLGRPRSIGRIASDIHIICVCLANSKLNPEFLTMAFKSHNQEIDSSLKGLER